jgi:hypothetical protein
LDGYERQQERSLVKAVETRRARRKGAA